MITLVDIYWPSTIPLPSIDYAGAPRNASITSPVESPRIFYRSRFFTSYSSIGVRWSLSTDELTAFRSFYLEELGNGIACFAMDLRFPLNSELRTWLVRFEGGYRITFSDGIAFVTAQLSLVREMEIADASS